MHDYFFSEVLAQGEKAAKNNEVPIGAVVVYKGEIIGRGYNTREENNDVLGHAEIMAIKEAAAFLRSWKLDDCDIYVSLEPCLMCYGVIKQARIRKIYFALWGKKREGYSKYIGGDDEIQVEFVHNERVESILGDFFKKLRKK